jgi:hydroxyethylthiazole kinase-like uncharacterized protein yjeF
MKLIPNLADIDRKTILQAGIPAETLMENAGTRVAEAVLAACKPNQIGVILCGPGNNGGDGFVCARKLHQNGYGNLSVIYTGAAYKAETLSNLEQLMMLPVKMFNAREQLGLTLEQITKADFIVDALFGSGLARPIAGLEAKLIQEINERRQYTLRPGVLAVDIPSGIDGASGQKLGIAVEADATITFAAAKPGLYLYPGKAHAGQVSIVDIGIPPELIAEDESPIRLIDRKTARCWLPSRNPDSHKYSYGHLLVIAGSHHMPGAAVLCAEAAMSSGAGLVTLAAPTQVFEHVPLMPEIIRRPLPDREHIGHHSLPAIQEALASGKYNAVLLGPGLDLQSETVLFVWELLAHLEALNVPVVMDSDALNALSLMNDETYQPKKHRQGKVLGPRFILTPHVGECRRLLQWDKSDVAEDLLKSSRSAQEVWNANVVLKSATTTIATTDGLLWISPTGNPGMATAGSGDVLSGLIAAMAAQLHAQDMPIWQAATLGVYLHGLAGDAAAAERTPHAMRASDITRHLPNAFKVLLAASEA